jgi:hypothetical protein
METQYLDKMPEHTTRGGLHWGAWEGKLALVDLYEDRFDAEKMERSYVVRFAVNVPDRKPIELSARAFERVIGMDIRVSDRSAPYEKTTFEIGNRMYNPSEYIHGSFAPAIDFRVKVSLAEMGDKEHYKLARSLRDRGFFAIETKRSAKQIKAMLACSFTDLQADHYEIANEADALLRATGFDTCASDEGCNIAWARFAERGVFVETRKGRVKWFLNPEGA